MKKLVLSTFALVLLAFTATAGYVVYPLATAWSIREAIRNGDSSYLERKIEWASVRETLRTSMTRLAFDLPDPDAPAAEKPGIWKRVKAYVGQGAVDRFVASYVTPEGLPKLFAYRKLYRETVSAEPEETLLPFRVRISRFWSRLKRAEFKSLTEFEVEMADRNDPSRLHVGLLRLEGLEWKLAELRIRAAGADLAQASDPAAATER